MSYQLFDSDNKEVTNSDLQNRTIWYKHGVKQEDIFVEKFQNKFDVHINPDKKINPTMPDLVHNQQLADLKCQNTPFFFAFKFEIDPTYAVTFNLKDAYNYGRWGKNHKNLIIFYWVDWIPTKMVSYGKPYFAKQLTGVWKIEFSRLDQMRLSSPIHWYSQRSRQYETRPEMQKNLSEFEPRLKDGKNIWSIREIGTNAACSYVFDLRNFERLE